MATRTIFLEIDKLIERALYDLRDVQFIDNSWEQAQDASKETANIIKKMAADIKQIIEEE